MTDAVDPGPAGGVHAGAGVRLTAEPQTGQNPAPTEGNCAPQAGHVAVPWPGSVTTVAVDAGPTTDTARRPSRRPLLSVAGAT
jgi:hypothetical protein